MSDKKLLDFLDELIRQTKAMTPEEFHELEKKSGALKLNPEDYKCKNYVECDYCDSCTQCDINFDLH